MKWHKVLLASLGGIFLLIGGFSYGRSSYQSDLIAVKYVDGRYGKAFYCVEVFGKKHAGGIRVFAKIHIGGLSSGYCHDCGEIGSAESWVMARQSFGAIRLDGDLLWIGDTFSIAKSQYENHR